MLFCTAKIKRQEEEKSRREKKLWSSVEARGEEWSGMMIKVR